MRKYNFLILQKEKENNVNHYKIYHSQVLKNARWEKLYNLQQNKQQKLDRMRIEKQLSIEEDIIKECTFMPKLNVNYKLKLQRSLIQRNNHWASQKENRISNMLHQELEKEQEIHTFKPKLNSNYKSNTHTIENILTSPDSYMNHVNRIRKRKSSNSKKKEMNTSMSSKKWKPKLTSPNKHNIFSDRLCDSSSSLNVKSLKKPLSNEKFNVIRTYSRNRLVSPKEVSKILDYDKIVFDGKKTMTVESLHDSLKKAFTLTKPTNYNKAIKLLHEELHAF